MFYLLKMDISWPPSILLWKSKGVYPPQMPRLPPENVAGLTVGLIDDEPSMAG